MDINLSGFLVIVKSRMSRDVSTYFHKTLADGKHNSNFIFLSAGREVLVCIHSISNALTR